LLQRVGGLLQLVSAAQEAEEACEALTLHHTLAPSKE
jgi:hypothetical protein